MSHVAIVQNVEVEGPGAIADILRTHHLDIRLIRPGAAPPVAAAIDGMAALVVMGGPMGVRDIGRDPHLQNTMDLIHAALEVGPPVLAVCLGSQLLAAALGADVRAGARREIGWHTVALHLRRSWSQSLQPRHRSEWATRAVHLLIMDNDGTHKSPLIRNWFANASVPSSRAQRLSRES